MAVEIDNETILFGPGEFPAKDGCYICNLSKSEPYINTGASIDYEGNLVICATCVKGWAQKLGMYTEESRENLLGQIGRLKRELAHLRPKGEAFDLFLATQQKLEHD